MTTLISDQAAPLKPLTVPHDAPETRLGAHLLPGGEATRFRVWTTTARTVQARVDGHLYPMTDQGNSFFEVILPVGAGTRYLFVLDGREVPDPYARFLPDGVHGEAEVDHPDTYTWQNTDWNGIALSGCVFYELHVGTFTPEGTYKAAQEKLPYLKDLGITAIQMMPVASYDGQRGWGYDGVAMYAPHAPYGHPDDLMAFIDTAHGLGLGVFLDVVYNHFGPAGNYLPSYSPEYFTERFSSAWGMGLDYAEPHMRRYVTGNALMWLSEYHFDGLRLDATAAMQDDSPVHILQELASEVHALGGTHLLLAEDHRNHATLVLEDGLDGIWVDDFHHEVRVTLTGEHEGYYGGFQGSAAELAHVVNRGWKYEGQQWAVKGEEHARGKSSDGLEAPSFVYCIQNHDQIGNRAIGDRLQQHKKVSIQHFRGASALLLTLPMTPLLFQGQEWAAETPFPFFSDHSGELGHLVTEGRKKEFAYFSDFEHLDVPDPQAESTFRSAKLDWTEKDSGTHTQTLNLYQTLLKLRREDRALQHRSRRFLQAGNVGELLWVRQSNPDGERVLLWNVGKKAVKLEDLDVSPPLPARVLVHSEQRDAPPQTLSALKPGEAALLGNG
ncbi:malto-oligosyltrehalose trehalohydrolase [Deinococcus arenicola]|uniref:Malto-oligosyltrehalose trehalohydrolase n=1 Tax=Deinococcus arenicola TaxID=2994950 RepID=A0ABU4DR94_9DEIO|nr:malto-oligosyltrehalose trehalohydrolase [Deinococcus sp. ZS9-10]MDV6374961.1 malto-oligosyltrehalose trehalohydrolase [Deinococcus sp. ZS9-10]